MKATIRVWQGYDIDPEEDDPTHEKEVPVVEDYYSGRLPLHDSVSRAADAEDTWLFADSLYHHGKYHLDVECDERVTLHVHTNDSVHGPDWSRPIEGGLIYDPDDDYPPFGCEIWGQVQMWVSEA